MKKLVSAVLLPSIFCLFVCVAGNAQNVGINNAAPNYPLDIVKSGGGYSLRVVNPSAATGSTVGLLFTNTTTLGATANFSASINATRSVGGGQYLSFGTSVSSAAPLERMRIDSFGNIGVTDGAIGIGTLAPTYGLHLVKARPSIGLYDESEAQLAGTIVGDSADLKINAYQAHLVQPTLCGNLLLQIPDATLLRSAGKVGVGTTDPKAKLHVSSNVMIGSGDPAAGYMLSVNGKIMSEEVRVQMDADWPDYVFQKGYHLRSLPELEKYIKINQHLPNIPSAAEVDKEGIALGDMQKRLMEKVEELTLYMIQVNKENEELKKEMKALKTLLEKK